MLRQFISKRASGTLLAIGFLLVLGISVASILLVERSGETVDRVEQSFTVSNAIANLRADIRRAESGQRGFLLTSDPRYLGDYEAALTRIGPTLDELDLRLGNQGEARPHLIRLRSLLDEKLAEMAETIALARAGRLNEALALIATDRGIALMDEVRGEALALLAAQLSLLGAQLDEAEDFETLLLVVTIVGALAIAALAVISVLLVRRSAQATLEANRQLERANTELESRVAERTADLQVINEEVQRFAYIVGHDLRAPLVNIMGFTSELEMLRERLGPAEAADPELRREFDESLTFIKSSIAKMDRLINVILQLSRSGKRSFTPRHIDLGQLVGGLIAEAGKRAEEAGVALSVGTLPAVVSDRPALEQVFGNLLDNAIKYRRPGVPGQVRIEGSERGPTVTILVSDNGRGIAPQDRERVFELFRRAGKQDQPGEGIGLAHVRALVRSIGGSVTLESRLGEGTTFKVILPKLWSPSSPSPSTNSDKAESP